jgi:hypothetical protein
LFFCTFMILFKKFLIQQKKKKKKTVKFIVNPFS